MDNGVCMKWQTQEKEQGSPLCYADRMAITEQSYSDRLLLLLELVSPHWNSRLFPGMSGLYKWVFNILGFAYHLKVLKRWPNN